MITATRRAAMLGALSIPTVAGFAAWRWRNGELSRLVHDSSLTAGRRFSEAAKAKGVASREIAGDRIRLAREVLAGNPSLVAGVTRHADFLLISDVAREAGYVEAAVLNTRSGRCSDAQCRPGWTALGRMGRAAGTEWAEALAIYAIDPSRAMARASTGSWFGGNDNGLVLGWVLARRS